MTERTNELIHELAHGVRPVRRLPSLARMAAVVAGVAAALLVARIAYWPGPFPKPGFGAIDLGTLVVHTLLGAAALVFALGASVPGRELLARVGAIALGVAVAAVGWIAVERLVQWPGFGSLQPDWFGALFSCGFGTVLPALIPAAILTRFCARAAPRRPVLVLLVAAAAAIALLTSPGVVSCTYSDELHQILAHLLAPAFGAGVLVLVALPLILAARRSIRD